MASKSSKYSKFEKKDFPFVYLCLLFPVAQFVVFWVYVNSSSILMAFQDTKGMFTLSNFKMVWNAFTVQDAYGINLGEALWHSVLLWIIGRLSFPIALVTTYILFKRIPMHYFWRICYIIPSLMGAILWVSLIKYMVGFDGPITQLIKLLGIELSQGAVRNGLLGAAETAFPTLCVLCFLFGLVGNNTIITGAYSRIPDEIFESAELDGAGFWRQCFVIAMPCIGSTIATLFTFSLCSIFTADYAVFLYSNGTGQPNMATIGFQLYYLTLKLAEGNAYATYGYPAALGVILTVITLPIVLLGRRAIDKIFETVEV